MKKNIDPMIAKADEKIKSWEKIKPGTNEKPGVTRRISNEAWQSKIV